MAKDIFFADYSSCRQTNREVTSNNNYLDDILGYINEGNSYISSAGGLFNTAVYNGLISEIKRYIGEEKTRYTNFYSKFQEFYDPLENIDKGLSQMLDEQLDLVEKHKDYDSTVAVIASNEQMNFETSLYYALLEEGLSNEEALKFAAMGDEESEELIKKYAAMSPAEFKKAIDELKSKVVKTPAELLLCDICSFEKVDSDLGVLNDISKEFGKGGTWVSVLEKGLLNRSLEQANLDVRSLTGQMTKLQNKIRTSQLSSAKVAKMTEEYERLAILRNEKMNKISGVTTAEKTIEGVCKAVGVAITLYQVYSIGKDDWNSFFEGGVELDDCIVDGGLSLGSLWVSTVAGAAAGDKIGGVVGTAVNPGVGTAAGIAAGVVVGGIVGLVCDGVVKPICIDIYDNALEPAGEWIGDRFNDLGDWWDSVWW